MAGDGRDEMDSTFVETDICLRSSVTSFAAVKIVT